jgi:hypothetical protein
MINRDNVTVELVNDLVDIKKLILMNISTAFRQDGTEEPQNLWDFFIAINQLYTGYLTECGNCLTFGRFYMSSSLTIHIVAEIFWIKNHRTQKMSYPLLNPYIPTAGF